MRGTGKIWPLLLVPLFLLGGCVGGTFGDHSGIEQYPLRPATDKEAARLRRCLKTARSLMEAHYKEKHAYYRTAGDIPADAYCPGLYLSLRHKQDGYEIMAQFHKDDNTVRWYIHQNGVMEEEVDPQINDLEF